MKKSILFVIDQLLMGGAEKSTLYLARALTKQNIFNVSLLCLKKNTNDYNLDKVEIIYLKQSMDRINQLNTYFSVYKKIRKMKPDIIHTAMIFSDWIIGIYKLFNPNQIIVCSAHSYQQSRQHNISFKHKFQFYIQSFLYRRFDKIVCVSNNLKKYMQEKYFIPSEKIEVIANGVDKPAKYPIIEIDSPFLGKLLYIGGLRIVKNVQILIKLMTELPYYYNLTIVGEGDQRQNLEDLMLELGLEKRIKFTGFIKDPHLLIKSFNILIIPSLHETFSLSALEGLIVGVPTISTKIGGITELYDSELEELLFKPNDLNELRKKIIHIEQNYTKIIRKIVMKRDKYLEYSLSNISAKYTTLFNNLLDG